MNHKNGYTMEKFTDWDELHDLKGLARALKRSNAYVFGMKSLGFTMINGRGSIRMAMDWLAKHPGFTMTQVRQVRFSRRKAASVPVSSQLSPSAD
jgi:hypothetical protein